MVLLLSHGNINSKRSLKMLLRDYWIIIYKITTKHTDLYIYKWSKLKLNNSFYCNQKNCDYRGVYNFGRPKEWQL